MTASVLTPASRAEWLELRHATIGASETPAILGVHPKVTPFELWARKSGVIVTGDSKQMRRGRLLEPVAIELLREEQLEWDVLPNSIPGGAFYRDLDEGLSATPDAFIDKRDFSGLGICQIKTVDAHVFRKDWLIDGDVQLPTHIAIQVVQEMYLTDASWGCVFAVVGFDLDTYLIEVKPHHGVITRIKREVPEFLRRVRENDPPPPNYARDGDTIAEIYDEDDGGTISLAGLDDARLAHMIGILEQRKKYKELEVAGSRATEDRKAVDAELRFLLGNATRGVLPDGRTIEARVVYNKGSVTPPYSYRPIKIKNSSKARHGEAR